MTAERLLSAAAVVAVCAVLSGCDPAQLPGSDTPLPPSPAVTLAPTLPAPPEGAAAASDVFALVESLPVKGRAPKTGYERAAFGPSWTDTDGNGCDTRNDVLTRDLVGITVDADCRVLSGTLADPYSGDTIHHVRGGGQVDIDHRVPLSDAWQKGAQQWTQSKRTKFANDPDNLQATSSTLNRAKGDGDAATWLPPNRAHWCAYGTRQVSVKAEYGLWVTEAEKDALRRLIGTCEAS